MKHPERVEDYLEHIVEAIDRATSYLEPLSGIEAFQKNSQVQDAVIRNMKSSVRQQLKSRRLHLI